MVTIFGEVAFNFQELFLKFFLEGKEIELRGITRKPVNIIVQLHPVVIYLESLS